MEAYQQQYHNVIQVLMYNPLYTDPGRLPVTVAAVQCSLRMLGFID